MTTVKVTIPGKMIPFIYLTPGAKGIWGDCKFFINEAVEKADWWVVVDGLENPETLICPAENTILITNENEYMKMYDPKFLRQFYRIVTCHQTLSHPRKLLMQQGHHSHLFWSRMQPGETLEQFRQNFKTYDELKAMKPADIQKTKLLSVVTSHKTTTAGQSLRHNFILEMKKHFGDRLDVFSNTPEAFGPGTKVNRLKWNSIAPYKYYLALENSLVPHYWTTNMPDAHLAGAYPFYFGHPTIENYYSSSMFTPIDIKDIPGSIAIIEKSIKDQTYEKHLKDIWEARNLWLDRYSLFPTIAKLIKDLPAGQRSRRIVIAPEQKIFLKNRIFAQLEKYPLLFKGARQLYRVYKRIRNCTA